MPLNILNFLVRNPFIMHRAAERETHLGKATLGIGGLRWNFQQQGK
jgi:hypothetical protein